MRTLDPLPEAFQWNKHLDLETLSSPFLQGDHSMYMQAQSALLVNQILLHTLHVAGAEYAPGPGVSFLSFNSCLPLKV